MNFLHREWNGRQWFFLRYYRGEGRYGLSEADSSKRNINMGFFQYTLSACCQFCKQHLPFSRLELEKKPFLPFAKGKCKYLTVTLENGKNYVLKRSQFSLFQIFVKSFCKTRKLYAKNRMSLNCNGMWERQKKISFKEIGIFACFISRTIPFAFSQALPQNMKTSCNPAF